MRLARKVRTGLVFANNYGAGGGVELPFGGMKRWGHGREKGMEALHGFGTLKTMQGVPQPASARAEATFAGRRAGDSLGAEWQRSGSGASHAPEQRQAGQRAGKRPSLHGGLKVLAKRQERHVLEGLQLDFPADRRLRRLVRAGLFNAMKQRAL